MDMQNLITDTNNYGYQIMNIHHFYAFGGEHDCEFGSGHEIVAVLLPGFAINW